jgi:hypothetical protein
VFAGAIFGADAWAARGWGTTIGALGGNGNYLISWAENFLERIFNSWFYSQ